MAVNLMKVEVENENDWVHPNDAESYLQTRHVYMYCNEEGYQLSPEFKSVVQAREWFAQMMSDYPYE